MKFTIKLSDIKYLSKYTNLLQRVYENTYTNTKIGLTKECFSKEIFNTVNTQNYLRSNLINTENQKTWFAFDNDKLIGSITLQNKGREYELRGFYVDIEYQGKGTGKLLLKKVKEFAGDKDIVLDIYAHNGKTINIYKKWGFKIDKKKGIFYRHWPEWPEELKVKSIYMRLTTAKD